MPRSNRKSRRVAPPRRAASKQRTRQGGAPPTSSARAARSGTASGVGPGMQSVNTYLAVTNIAATMRFLETTFGFTRGVCLPDSDGNLRYAEMHHGSSVVMLIRKGDEATASGGAAALYTYVEDVDSVLQRARDAGAGVGDAEDKPWGDRVGVVTDPDGYRWVLATFRKLVPFES